MRALVLALLLIFCACKDDGDKAASEQYILPSDELKQLVRQNQLKALQRLATMPKSCSINKTPCKDSKSGVEFSILNAPISFMQEAKLQVRSDFALNSPEAYIIGLNMDMGVIEIDLESQNGSKHIFQADFMINSCIMNDMLYRLELYDDGRLIASTDFNVGR